MTDQTVNKNYVRYVIKKHLNRIMFGVKFDGDIEKKIIEGTVNEISEKYLSQVYTDVFVSFKELMEESEFFCDFINNNRSNQKHTSVARVGVLPINGEDKKSSEAPETVSSTTADEQPEIWKEIPGYLDYEITLNGLVRNKKTKQLCKVYKYQYLGVGKKYISIILDQKYPTGKNKRISLGKAILASFGKKTPQGWEYRHIKYLDGDPENINIENLSWTKSAYTRKCKKRHPHK